VETEIGRIAFGPVAPADLPGMFEAGFPGPADHALALGAVDSIDWLASQQRLTFLRAGWIDPVSLDDYRSMGGFKGLDRALKMSAQEIVDEVKESGLRGRGGAAFPTGIKWQTVLDTPAEQKYIVCNADEGDSGTFADRLLMEADPYQLVEGMTIAGLAVGADEGYIYLRSEYPHARAVLTEAISRAEQAGWLGETFVAPAGNSAWSYGLGPGPIFAARKLPCWTAWKVSAA
jgi:formate dehydrogenase iron-sulfur subunit